MKNLKLYNKKSQKSLNILKELFLSPYILQGDEKLIENIFSKYESKDKKYKEFHIS